MSKNAIVRWLDRMTRPNRTPVRRGRVSPSRSRPRFEALEDRTVPTVNLFVDFGDSFPSGGLTTTNNTLRTTLAGPDFRQATDGTYTYNPGVTDSTVLTLSPLNNYLGSFTATDKAAIKSEIISDVSRLYAPFDVNVKVAAATSTGDVTSKLAASGGADGYVFVTGLTSPSGTQVGVVVDGSGSVVGQLYGNSNATEIAAHTDNYDNSEVILVNQVTTDATLAARANISTALANLVAHESGHDFGLAHVYDQITSNAYAVQDQSDVMAQYPFDGNLTVPQFFSRYTLVAGDANNGASGPVSTSPVFNDYTTLAANLGTKSGGPAYVTGTGGSDEIDVTAGTGTTGTVVVKSYSDGTRTSLINQQTYTLSDVSHGIQVYAGYGNDQVVLTGDFAGGVYVDGGVGTDTVVIQTPGAVVTATNAGGLPTERKVFNPEATTDVTFFGVESSSVPLASQVTSVTFGSPVLFVVGPDGRLRESSYDPITTHYYAFAVIDSSDTFAPGSPLATWATSGSGAYLDVFGVDASGNIRQAQYASGAWGAWTVNASGAFIPGTPLTVYEAGGYVDLYGVDASGNIRLEQFSPGSGWSSLYTINSSGAFRPGTPLTLSVSGSYANLYGIDTAGNVRVEQFNGTVWGLYTINSSGAFRPGTALSLTVAGSYANLYGVDASGNVRVEQFNGTAWNLYTIDSSAAFRPGTSLSVYVAGSYANLYGVGADGAARQEQFNGSAWNLYTNPAGVAYTPSAPLTVQSDGSTTFLFGVNAAGQVVATKYASGTWVASVVDTTLSMIVT